MSEIPTASLQGVEPLAALRALLLPRAIEEKMLRLIRQGRLSKWFSGYGQEAIAVGCTLALREEDYLLPMHRNLGLWTGRGVPLKPLFCQLMGREGGYTNGRDRTFHFGLPEKRIVGMISHLGAMWPVACGLGLAARLKGEPYVACALLGEGATREGDFHEALSLAAIWKLPVLFVVENNGYGLSTPTREAVPVENIADAAAGYGVPGVVVDGNSLTDVVAALTQAAARARAGEGPTLLEMKTFRMRGHEEASGTKYVPEEVFAQWRDRDPVVRFVQHVIENGLVVEEELAALRAEIEREVDEAAEFALAQPLVASTAEKEEGDVYAPAPTEFHLPEGPQTEKRFIDAISDGLRQAMERDEKIVLMGQDVAEYGGVFKVTQGFVERFGKDRIRNTPIMESGVLGAAMGLALEGFHPVVEMQYGDFITCGFNQIVNNLGTTHYRWGAPLPVTIRAPFGGGIGAGPFHSQSMEAWFAHAPGLKVVVPSTPQTAKGLLMAALREPNPVLFFEHKMLYRALKGSVTDAPFELPLGQARVAREGRDLTIVTYGVGVVWAEEEARKWAAEGVEIEVVDLQTLVPWDRAAVLASVAKTNRLVVVHEAWRTGGFGAEVAAEVAEAAFAWLDAPPVRVGARDFPVPFSPPIEGDIFSARARLHSAIATTLHY